MTLKRLGQQCGWILVMMVTGTAIDWAVHHSHDAWYVEPSYFTAKLIFGTLWGLFSLWLLRRVLRTSSARGLALGVPALIALFLQTKYFYQGRAMDFVVTFLFLHYLMFLPAAWFIFTRHREVFVGPESSAMRPRWVVFISTLIGLEALFWLYFHLFPPF